MCYFFYNSVIIHGPDVRGVIHPAQYRITFHSAASANRNQKGKGDSQHRAAHHFQRRVA